MAVLDSTIVNVALPTIVHHYNSSIEYGQWVVSGYLISMAVMLLSAHWFADRFGYKSVYLVGLLIFTLGSWLCSVAPSLEFLIGARFFEGIGSGVVQPIALAMILREFDEKQRGLAIGFWAMASGAAVSLGPFLGGYLIQDFNWSMIFLINVPVGILSLISVFFVLRDVRVNERIKFDFVGFTLMIIWIPLFLYSMVKFGVGESHVALDVVLLIISLCVMGLFIWYELKRKNPLIDLRMFANRNFAMAMIITFLYGISLMGGNYILPEYLQHTLGYSVYQSGIVFLPVGIIQVIMSPITGSLIKKLGDFKLIFAGMIVILSYFIISVNFGFDTPKWLIMVSLYLRGLGIGLSFTALSHLSFKGLAAEEMGQASGVASTVRQLAGSVGVAVLTMVLVINTQAVNYLDKSQNYLDGIKSDFLIMLIAIIVAFIPLLLLKIGKKS